LDDISGDMRAWLSSIRSRRVLLVLRSFDGFEG